jgi:chromosome segregation ATPase
MTPEEFKAALNSIRAEVAQLSELREDVAKLTEGQQRSRDMHAQTQARVDGVIKGVHESLRQDLRVVHSRMDTVVSDIRQGLREDLQLMLEPIKEKQSSHSKRIDDHETRIRTVEAKGIRRDVVLGGVSSGITIAVIEGLRFLQKMKGGG